MRYLSIIIMMLAATAVSAQSGRNAKKKSDGLDFRHIANFTPFSGVVAYGNINPGVGIDYEYIISPEHGIGVHIPFVVGFAGPDQDDYYYGNTYKHTSIHTAPGIRFHTARRGSTVDFVTGPSVLIGNMHFSPNEDYWGGAAGDPFDYGIFGFAADNTLNFYRNHFVFGFDVRVGTLAEVRDGTRFFIHFGMHFGGNF